MHICGVSDNDDIGYLVSSGDHRDYSRGYSIYISSGQLTVTVTDDTSRWKVKISAAQMRLGKKEMAEEQGFVNK